MEPGLKTQSTDVNRELVRNNSTTRNNRTTVEHTFVEYTFAHPRFEKSEHGSVVGPHIDVYQEFDIDLCRDHYLIEVEGVLIPSQTELRSDWQRAIKALRKSEVPIIAVCFRDQSGPVYGLLTLDEQGRLNVNVESESWCPRYVLDAFSAMHQLTRRELEVLWALCEGDRPKTIAKKSNNQLSTIKTHTKSILRKTNERTIQDVLMRLARLSSSPSPSTCAI